MDQKELYSRLEAREQELQAALLKVQQEGEDEGLIYAYGPKVDYSFSRYWFQLETFAVPGRLHRHYFACKTLEGLKKALRWVLTNTAFYDVTAFVEGNTCVTFYQPALANLDREFDYYFPGEADKK